MNRTVLWIANGALLVLCCFLAARVATALAAEWLAPRPDTVRVPERSGGVPQRDWSERRVILGRNLFNVSTLEPEGGAAEPTSEELEKTELPLELLGTAASADPKRSWAAVKDLEKGAHQVVRVDDVLKGQARVLRIERRRLVLQNGSQREELALSEEAGASSSGSSPRPSRSASASRARERLAERVRRLGENRFSVPRSDMKEAARNPASLFSQARILPKYEGGSMVGVQVSSIKSGSLFEEIGIEDGDTIKEFNGIEVTGQQQSAKVLRELTEAEEFDVTVTGRNGETRQLRYELR